MGIVNAADKKTTMEAQIKRHKKELKGDRLVFLTYGYDGIEKMRLS